jgi:phosphorylcholine metabolism protein LicD
MAGRETDKEKLNRTLEEVCGILNKNNINDWFIMFGTLLGIVRENSCIEGDDDLDIMINCDYQHLRSTFEQKGFNFMVGDYGIKNPDTILKSHPTQEFGSVDFYMCNVNESGDFHTPWHGVISTDSYVNIDTKTFIYKEWLSTVLQLPNNYENKLINMYGSSWKVPQSKSCRLHIGRV